VDEEEERNIIVGGNIEPADGLPIDINTQRNGTSTYKLALSSGPRTKTKN